MEVAGSLPALLHTAENTFKFARSLRRYAKRVKGAEKSIRQFSKDVEVYAFVVEFAYHTLDRHCKLYERTQSSDAQIFGYILERKVIENLMHQCRLVEDDINALQSETRALCGLSRFMVRLRWGPRERQIAALLPKMESVGQSLNIVVAVLQLEQALQQPQSTDLHSEIKWRERAVRTQVDIQKKNTEALSRHQISIINASFVTSIDAVQDVAGYLGEVMVEQGQVLALNPRQNYAKPQSQRGALSVSSSIASRYSSSYVSLDPLQPSVSFVSTWLQSTSSKPGGTYLGHTLQAPQQRPLPVRSVESIEPLRANKLKREGVIGEDNEVDTPRSHVSVRTEGDFLTVRNDGNHLRLNPVSYRGIDGYILTSSSPCHTTVFLDEDFGANLISQAYATSLGVNIEPFDDDNEVV